MKINIADVRQAIGGRQSFSFQASVEKIAGEMPDFWLTGDIAVAGEVVNTGRYLQIGGDIRATSRQSCHRCLADYSHAVAIPFSENFRESGDSEGDPDFTPYQGDEIDLSEIVREALVMAEPLKALCRDDCRGLCPKCGASLNTAPCSCDLTTVDPRLAALEKLLDKK